MRSDLCVEHWLLSDSLCKQKSQWIITINGKMNVWKCKLIFPTDILQQKIEITDFKPLLYVCMCVCLGGPKVIIVNGQHVYEGPHKP